MDSALLLHYLLFVAFGYLLGSISTAIITCQLMGLPDPRSEGSGNPGATNVLRFGGKKAAIITLLGDGLKGFIPVLICSLIVQHSLNSDLIEHSRSISLLPTITGLAAFLGHLYPVFFDFKGGKGVATALGALFGIAWPIGLMTAGTWLLMAFGFKISGLAALIAFALTPLFTAWWLQSTIITALITFMTVLIFWRHRSNIQRLLQGQEDKIGNKP